MVATTRAWKAAIGGPCARGPLVAACSLSVALHAVLFASSRLGAWGVDAAQRPSPPLQVTLSAPPRARDEAFVAPTEIKPPANRPRYTRMLPFSPALVPPFDEQAYVPASRLTQEPTPIDEIQVRYPRGVHHLRVLRAALTLFIDEHGHVANVRVDDPALPHAYERAAIEAFAAGRFHPGLDGVRPVKSRLRVRVAFDSGDSGETMLAPLPRSLS
jgi:hypothetical protein